MNPRGLYITLIAVAVAALTVLWEPMDAAHAQGRVPYTFAIEGVEDAELRDTLRGYSDALARREEGAASAWHLRRRANRDSEQFLAYLRSRGHYAATVEAIVDDPETDGAPLSLRYVVDIGPVYRFRDVVIVVPSGIEREVEYPPPAFFGVAPGSRALSSDILGVEPAVLRWLREEGYPFPDVHPRRVVVDHDGEAVDVRFRIDPGPRARFGDPLIEGLDGLREQVVLNEIPWESGDLYRQATVNEARNTLYDTGLFAVARIDPAGPVTEEGLIPMRFQLTERKHRTISVGAYVYTDEGVLGRIRWEDRNRRGLGNTLHAEFDAGTQIQRIAVGYQVRHFRSNRQTLNFTFEGANESRDAFDSTRVGGRTWVDRELTEGVRFSYGIALRFDEVTQQDTKNSFGLISFPVALRVDRSNDLLNPTRGWRFNASAEPFLDVGGVGSYFLKTEVSATHYWPVGDEERLVIANRIRLGSIVGAERSSIPANERFYSGGGSSLRGYNYLTVSPLDGDDPIGGRSVLEASLELRRAITETIGVVAFLDAGAAYDSEYPDFGESFRYGAGLGVRYFSPIGPLRFDFAVPLNKRGIDDRYEIYLSIGQAF